MANANEIRKVRRQQAQDRLKDKEARQRVRQRMAEAREQKRDTERIRTHNAIITGMVPRITGAIDSWAGRRVPVTIRHPYPVFSALTDFESITIHLPEVKDVTLDFAADLRGLAYHEAGHILMSVPYAAMVDAVMPLDDPDDYHQQRARESFIRETTGLSNGMLHRSWNMLEDQRMESAMVRESVNLGRYYNVIVLTHVLDGEVSPNAHLLLYGRRHVDATVRLAARSAFIQAHGLATCQEAERLIDTYKRSNDLTEMWECVGLFGRLANAAADADSTLDSIDDHQPGESESKGAGEGNQERLDRSMTDPCPQGTPGAGEAEGGESDESDDDAEGEGSGAGEGDEEDEAEGEEDGGEGNGPSIADRTGQGNEGGTGGADESANDPDWTRELLQEALDAAREERNQDGQALNDVRAYNHALADSHSNLPMARIPTTPDPDPEAIALAIRLNRALRNLMDQARAETAPIWQLGQTRGIVDVRSYVTRQPGQTDFYRNIAPGGDMKLPDMAVSVLLDGSGSMGHLHQELAIAAFGMKSACDVAGIPCTVTVYDTDAYLLWDADDRPLDVPYNIVPNGGTDPKRALDLLDLQKHDKANHLVIIMTDGQWSGSFARGNHGGNSLAHYQAPDRDIVMFYLNCSPMGGPAGRDTCSMNEQIDDLLELPKFLQRYIVRAL